MQQVFEESGSDSLRGAIIWLPMLQADNRSAAEQRAAAFSDPRLAQFWDEDREFGRLFARRLALRTAIAWDVYLVYPSGAAWEMDLPPVPALWMHQLDEEPARRLDPPTLRLFAKALLERKSSR